VNQGLFSPGSCIGIAITSLHLQQGDANGSLIYNAQCQNLIIDGCVVDGDLAGTNVQPLIYSATANTVIHNKTLRPVNQYQYAIQLHGASAININSEVNDNRFENTGKDILVSRTPGSQFQVEGLRLVRNTFLTTSTEQITVQAAFHIDISHNIIDQSRYMAIWPNAISGPIDSILISHNYLGLIPNGGVGVYIPNAAYSTADVVIGANRFASGTYGIATGSNANIIVANNIMTGDGTTGSTGIQASGLSNILGNIVQGYVTPYLLGGAYNSSANWQLLCRPAGLTPQMHPRRTDVTDQHPDPSRGLLRLRSVTNGPGTRASVLVPECCVASGGVACAGEENDTRRPAAQPV